MKITNLSLSAALIIFLCFHYISLYHGTENMMKLLQKAQEDRSKLIISLEHDDQVQSSLGYDTVRSNVAQYPHLENSTLKNITLNERNVSTIVAREFLHQTKDFGIRIEGARLFLRGCNSHEPFNDSIVRKAEPFEQFFCKSSENEQGKEINFFSSAVGEKYENVLPMYAFFALHSNENSTVEMVVKNATHFVERKYDVLNWLSQFALPRSSQICVRNYDHDHSKRTTVTNTWRFLEVPYVKAKYTYMADIDIYLTESVLDSKRFQQMDHFKLPYSNSIRANTTRLTGVMLVDTKRFYTETLIQAQQILDAGGNDEVFLYKLVEKAGHGLPPDPSSSTLREDDKVLALYRPVHGIHLSFNRGPGKPLCQMSYDRIRALLLSYTDIYGLLCRDYHQLKVLGSIIEESYTQRLYNMTVKDGVCSAGVKEKQVKSVSPQASKELNGTDAISQPVEATNKPPQFKSSAKESSSRPVLRFGVGNGLSNQFMSFIDAMIVAILYKDQYDVELPTMWGDAYFSENKSQPMEFGELYDANHFIKCISNYTGKTFNIYKEKAPTDFEEKNIVYTPKHDSRKINSDTNWNSTHSALLKFAQPRTVVNIGRFYAKWVLKVHDSKSFQTRRLVVQCIKPAPSIKNVVSKVAQKMRSTYPSSNIIAIHPRLEDDWKEHSRKQKLRDGWISEKEWIRRLKDSFNITSSTKILMIGGAKFDRSHFYENNLTAFTKNDFLEPEDLSPFKYRSSLAAIDFFLAKEADNFYGFMWSSMDLMIYESRLYNCIPTNVIHTNFGDKWLKVVSGWSNAFFFYRLEDIACHYRSHAPTCINIPTLSENCLDISTARSR